MIIKVLTPNGQLLANGELNQTVWKVEGNYYFDRSVVDFNQLMMNPTEKYTCPIKQGTCDYYDLVDSSSGDIFIEQLGWIYEHMENHLFNQIAGKIAFYQNKGLNFEIVE